MSIPQGSESFRSVLWCFMGSQGLPRRLRGVLWCFKCLKVSGTCLGFYWGFRDVQFHAVSGDFLSVSWDFMEFEWVL